MSNTGYRNSGDLSTSLATVAEAHSKNWLYIFGRPIDRANGGIERAVVGPLAAPVGSVVAHFSEAIFPPGMKPAFTRTLKPSTSCVIAADLAQYWFHRAFHRVPFLWDFHAVHHSAKSMDWLAGVRMHFVEIILLRGVTSLPLLTLGFAPSVMQAYVAFVCVYASLVHANLRGDFDRLGQFVVTPRFHHWHHAIEAEGVDKNFAIHFPLLDRLFGTFHFPAKRWPTGYGVPEAVPSG